MDYFRFSPVRMITNPVECAWERVARRFFYLGKFVILPGYVIEDFLHGPISD